MNNNGAHYNLPTQNSSASSSTGDTPLVPNATPAALSSTTTLPGPAPQHETLTFGTPAEQEGASRPRRDLGQQRQRLIALRAFLLNAAQRAQSQPRATQAQPPLPLQHAPQPVLNHPPHPLPQPQAPHHQQAHPPTVPAVPNPNVPGPFRNAQNGIANENAGFGVGNGPPGMPAPMWNADIPPPPHIPHPPQDPMYPWPAYGHNIPPPHYYPGYPGPYAPGVAPFAAPHQVPPKHAPPPPALFAGPPYHQLQFQQAQIGPVEGSSTGSKRKAVDANDTTRQKQRQKRHRPQDDPDFVSQFYLSGSRHPADGCFIRHPRSLTQTGDKDGNA